MPSTKPLPTINRLVRAASAAVTGERDPNADTRSGSLYNHTVGPTAILFAREADRDEDLFQDIYFNNASGDQLTDLIQQRADIAEAVHRCHAKLCAVDVHRRFLDVSQTA